MPLTEPYTPVEVTDVQIAFPADALDRMPEWDVIPEKFTRRCWQASLWSDVFAHGLDAVSMLPAEGVDPELAWRHLQSILGSYAPKHEHKIAACAFLTSVWFEGVRWKVPGDGTWRFGGVLVPLHPDEKVIPGG